VTIEQHCFQSDLSVRSALGAAVEFEEFPLTQNMFTNPKARKPLTRATLAIGLALAAIGAAGLGSGVARAVPQQPLLVDDPLPVPTPAGADPASPVNIANAIFAEISNVLSAVFPGSSSVLMPADTATNPLSPGVGNSGLVPPGYPSSQAPGLPAYPSAVPPGYPASVPPGYPSSQAPGLPAYPSAVPPGYPTSVPPGQAPPLPAQPSPVSPAQSVPVV
jgi:hypothetical protein